MVTQMPPMYGQQSMANRYAPTMPWNYGYGVGGGVPMQQPADRLAVLPPGLPPGGGRFQLSQGAPAGDPTGTTAVVDQGRDALLERAAQIRQDEQNRRIAKEREKAQNVNEWQAAGSAIGGLTGTALSFIPPLAPFAPALVAGGAALGSQVGRVGAGGDLGFGTVMPAVTSTASTLPQVSRDYREHQRRAAVDRYVASMPPEQYGAYVQMPPTVAGQFNQGNFKMFEEVWLPMYNEYYQSAPGAATGDLGTPPPMDSVPS